MGARRQSDEHTPPKRWSLEAVTNSEIRNPFRLQKPCGYRACSGSQEAESLTAESSESTKDAAKHAQAQQAAVQSGALVAQAATVFSPVMSVEEDEAAAAAAEPDAGEPATAVAAPASGAREGGGALTAAEVWPRDLPLEPGLPDGWRQVEKRFEKGAQAGRTYVRWFSDDGRHSNIPSAPQVIRLHCQDTGQDIGAMLANFRQVRYTDQQRTARRADRATVKEWSSGVKDLGLEDVLSDPAAVADMQAAGEMLKALGVEDGFRDPKQLLNLLQSAISLKHTLEAHDLGEAIRDPAVLDAVLVRGWELEDVLRSPSAAAGFLVEHQRLLAERQASETSAKRCRR